MTIIWCMFPEIWTTANRISCHLGPFFALLPPMDRENQNSENMKLMSGDIIILHVYHKWQSYDEWFLRYGVWQTEFFVNLDRFLPFYPPDNPKNKNFEKMNKRRGDIIILHMCSIDENHRMYGPWYMEPDRQNFLSFWTVFCPFTILTTAKIKILKNWKKNTWRYYHFTQVYQKSWSSCYTVPEIQCMTDVIFIFHFGLFFALLGYFLHFYLLTTQKIKILDKWRRYHHFTHVYQKLWSYDVRFLKYGVWQTDGQMKIYYISLKI